MAKATLHLLIDQDIPVGEEGEQMINEYIDLLAQTKGLLSWESIHWDLQEEKG